MRTYERGKMLGTYWYCYPCGDFEPPNDIGPRCCGEVSE
jgi:hypothetical protein